MDAQQDPFFDELRRIRETKGLSFEDLARQSKIRVSILEAIEKGDFGELPEPVYTRNFIKTYAALLGIDGAPLLTKYARFVERSLPPQAPEPPRETREATVREPSEATKRSALSGRTTQWIWLVAAVLVLVALGTYVCQDRNAQPPVTREAVKPAEKAPEQKPPETAVPPAPMPEPPPPPQPAAPAQPQPQPPAPAPAQPGETKALEKQTALVPVQEKKEAAAALGPVSGVLNLTIEATEPAWVQVRADRSPIVQQLLNAGEKLNTEARERIIVDLGNAGGVLITFHGQSLGSPGKRGEVIRIVYPEGKRVEKEKKKPEEPRKTD